MNAGLGDAANLAWKLATVIKNHDEDRNGLLDTYETERLPFAQILVKTTDRLFTLITDRGVLGKLIRGFFIPYIAPLMFKLPGVPYRAFRAASQTAIQYRQSALSLGHQAGTVQAGDRLPWIELDGQVDNYAPLTSLQWQLHVYGTVNESFTQFAKARSLSIHAFTWNSNVERKGFKENSVYLIRPDGYIGMICDQGDLSNITTYLMKWSCNKN